MFVRRVAAVVVGSAAMLGLAAAPAVAAPVGTVRPAMYIDYSYSTRTECEEARREAIAKGFTTLPCERNFFRGTWDYSIWF